MLPSLLYSFSCIRIMASTVSYTNSLGASAALSSLHQQSSSTTTTSLSSSQQQPQLLSDKLQLYKLKYKQYADGNYWDRDIQVIGHRGALYQQVENTCSSFQKCIDLQCDGVELDVFLLKDGNLVVFHGSGTDKVPGSLKNYCVPPCDTKQSILDLTLEEAQQLRFVNESAELPALQHQATATAVKIPTLRQVLELLKPTDLQIKMELKGQGTVEPCIALVEEFQMQHQVVFSSFHHDRVQLVKKLRPDLQTAAIFSAHVPDNFLELVDHIKPTEIHLRYDTCSIDRVAAAHQAGYRVMAWCRGPKAMEHDMSLIYRQEERRVYEMVMQTGVDAICCNRPDVVLDLLSQKRNPVTDDSDSDE